MAYYIGQAFGILATICCFVLPLFKKKWQMLAATAAANICFTLNMLLIGQIGSALFLYPVGVVQAAVSYIHLRRDTKVSVAENIIFMVAPVVCGIAGYSGLLDLLPIAGSVLNVLATFQRDEQKTRLLILFNATCFFVYCLAVGSTSMFAELLAAITTIIAMVKYRKKKA